MPKSTIKMNGARPVAATTTPDLARLIMQVMTHPDCPYDLWDKMTDSLVEMDDSIERYAELNHVRFLLRDHLKRGGKTVGNQK